MRQNYLKKRKKVDFLNHRLNQFQIWWKQFTFSTKIEPFEERFHLFQPFISINSDQIHKTYIYPFFRPKKSNLYPQISIKKPSIMPQLQNIQIKQKLLFIKKDHFQIQLFKIPLNFYIYQQSKFLFLSLYYLVTSTISHLMKGLLQQKSQPNLRQLQQTLQQQWICPITKLRMIDPVTTIDGHTYQRSAIQKWFSQSSKSPKTGIDLQSKKLVPNISLKNLKQKLTLQFPLIVQKMHELEYQNKLYKSQIKELKEQNYYLEQKIQCLNEFCSKNKKSECLIKSKKEIVEVLKKDNSQFCNRLREMNKRMREMKNQNTEIAMDFDKKMKQMESKLEKVRKDSEKNFEDMYQGFKKLVSATQKETNHFIFMVAAILSVINRFKDSKSLQLASESLKDQTQLMSTTPNKKRSTKKKHSLQIAPQIQKQIQQKILNPQNHLSLTQTKHYPIIFHIIKALKLQPKSINEIGYYMKAIMDKKNNYHKMKYFMTFKTFQNLYMKKIPARQRKQNENLKEIGKKNMLNIQGIENLFNHDVFNDKKWEQFCQFAQDLENLQILNFQESQITQITFRQLQKFQSLKYVNFLGNKLSQRSKLQIQTYKRRNSQVIVLYDQIQSRLSFLQRFNQALGRPILWARRNPHAHMFSPLIRLLRDNDSIDQSRQQQTQSSQIQGGRQNQDIQLSSQWNRNL